jgi:polyphosphate kinase 2 (PPK2 family)
MGKKKMSKNTFEKEMKKLQIELCALQEWVRKEGLRVVVVFEGRDAAGKGGVIKCIKERVSPRIFRVVALPAPTDRQKTQMYMQRYIPHMPAAGEVVLFDRSWYNRAGVERVMGFCTGAEYYRFLRSCPNFEQQMIEDGIFLIKWKLSPMDIESWARWWDYTEAYEAMIQATDTEHSPWYRVQTNDKRAARLNCISHLLSKIPYEKVPFEMGPVPERLPRGPHTPDDVTFKHTVPELF